MKKRKLLITSFILLCLVQTAVPLSMIARREFTLRNGRVYKFKTAPVDPYDAFRGRFVALAVPTTGPHCYAATTPKCLVPTRQDR